MKDNWIKIPPHNDGDVNYSLIDLPKEGEQVFIYVAPDEPHLAGHIFTAYLIIHTQVYLMWENMIRILPEPPLHFTRVDYHRYENVTHWMPLPKPPDR